MINQFKKAPLLPTILFFLLSPFAQSQQPQPTSVALINNGQDALLYRIHLIRAAQKTIDIQTFNWTDDESGNAFMQACVEAAQRGVKVRFLMDHLFSDHDLDTAVALIRTSPNFQIRRYRPADNRLASGLRRSTLHTLRAFRKRNQRMHNKIIVVDGRIAILGGRNIANQYFDQSEKANYLDRDVLLTGPLIPEVAESFQVYWDYKRSIPLEELKDVADSLEKSKAPEWTNPNPAFQEKLNAHYDSEKIQRQIDHELHTVNHAWLTIDPPGKNNPTLPIGLWAPSTTADDLMAALRTAESSILIQSPYLVIDRSTKRFLRKLKKQIPDLDLTIITDSYASTGNMAAYAATFRSRPRALALGFQIFELKPEPVDEKRLIMPPFLPKMHPNSTESAAPYTSIHAKSMIIDHRISYVGSFNFDPRSIHLNTETGIFIDDPAFAERLENDINILKKPGNSWIAQKRNIPLKKINRSIEWISQHLPLDLWPISSTTTAKQASQANQTPTPIGVLPTPDRYSKKRTLFRLNKAIGLMTRPII